MKKKSWRHRADQTFRLLLKLCFFLSNKLDYWNKLETTFSWLKICWGSKWMAVPVHNWSPTPASKVFEREAIRKYVYIPSYIPNRRTNTFCKCELSGMMCGCFFPWAASWRLAKQLFSSPPSNCLFEPRDTTAPFEFSRHQICPKIHKRNLSEQYQYNPSLLIRSYHIWQTLFNMGKWGIFISFGPKCILYVAPEKIIGCPMWPDLVVTTAV